MLITSKRKKQLQQNFIINHAGQQIKPSQSVKYLGLTIDSTLSGEHIVDSILAKCNARLKFLYRYKNILNIKTKKLLVSALIQSHFDYASTAWYFSLTKNLKKQLQVAQNKMVRYILDLDSRTHIGQTELDQINMLSVTDRARQLMLNHMFNINNKTAPSYLRNHFRKIYYVYNTRGASQHNWMSKSSHGAADANFHVLGCNEWNKLTDSIKTTTTKDSFKKLVKKYLKAQAHLAEINSSLRF